MNGASQSLSLQAGLAFPPRDPQRRTRQAGTSVTSKCQASATKSVFFTRCLDRHECRQRRRTLSVSVAASASPSNDDDDSVSFQRTKGTTQNERFDPSDDPFRVGDLVDGRFRVEGVLGRGALGVTFAVVDEKEPSLSIQLALKATRLRGPRGGWKALDLAEREAAALRSLSGHPNIPRFVSSFDVDRVDDRVRCLVEERVREGKTLSALVSSGERASPEDVARLARDVLSALSHLASRSPPVTHRDVKPENIVLEGGRWGGKAFLVDFSGVAAASLAADEAASTNSSSSSSSSSSFAPVVPSAAPIGPGTTVVGTFGFMAPEQFRGAAGAASDIYSLGATLLLALTGRQPSSFPLGRGLRLEGARAALEAARAPRLLAEIVEAALEPSAEDRPTADEALTAVEAALRAGGKAAAAGASAAANDEDDEEESGGVVFSGRAFGASSSSSSVVVDLDRGFDFSSSSSLESSSASSSSETNSSGSRSSLSASASTSSSSSSISKSSLTRPPPGARSKVERLGRTFIVDVPAGPLLAPERAGSAAFAVVWTASVAAWTATALAAGSLFAAAFSIPFWLSGAAVAKDALGGSLSGDSRLEIGPRTWKLVKDKRRKKGRGFKSLLLGGEGGKGDDDDGVLDPAFADSLYSSSLLDDDEFDDDADVTVVGSGQTSTLRGARVSVTAYVNGVPRTRLELIDGFNSFTISEDVPLQEQRWLAKAINAAVERATGKAPPLAQKKKKNGDDESDDDDDFGATRRGRRGLRLPPRGVIISDGTYWGPGAGLYGPGIGTGGYWGSGGGFYDDDLVAGGGGGQSIGGGDGGFVDDEF